MIKTKVLENDVSTRMTRVLTLSLMGVVSFLMLGLAVSASAATLTRQLDIGARGQDVSDVQTYLATDNTIYPQGLVTGYFGRLTSSAVSNFQARNGLQNVGRVGPLTLVLLNSLMNGDNSAPVINSLNVNTSRNSVTVSWNTNENASAVVYYSTSPIYMTEGSPTSAATVSGSSVLVNSDLRISHSTTISGLNSNTTYYYVVYVRDGLGNENLTWPATFQTAY